MKTRFACTLCLAVAALSTFVSPAVAAPPLELKLLGVKKVWDKAPHSAFTDLVRFKDKWYLTFREAASHMYTAPAGKIRVLVSDDGDTWTSAALLKYGTDDDDLRDSKLSVMPDGRLLLICALSPKEDHAARQSYAYTSENGTDWDGPVKVGEFNWWLWRVVWSPDGTGYGLGYDSGAKLFEWTERLYRTKDGLHYETLLPQMMPHKAVNEAAMLFRKDGSAVVLVRRDTRPPSGGIVGTAKGDLRDWTFRELKQPIGGPQIIELPNGRIVAAVRLYDKERTSLGPLDPEAGTFEELLTLPSGGDTSYPGMVWHNDVLWVSYYSSHEGRTSIYVAKVKVGP